MLQFDRRPNSGSWLCGNSNWRKVEREPLPIDWLVGAERERVPGAPGTSSAGRPKSGWAGVEPGSLHSAAIARVPPPIEFDSR